MLIVIVQADLIQECMLSKFNAPYRDRYQVCLFERSFHYDRDSHEQLSTDILSDNNTAR